MKKFFPWLIREKANHVLKFSLNKYHLYLDPTIFHTSMCITMKPGPAGGLQWGTSGAKRKWSKQQV